MISLITRVLIFGFASLVLTQAQFLHHDLEEYPDDDLSAMNDSLPISSSFKTKSITTKSSVSSAIITALSTRYTPSSTINNRTSTTQSSSSTSTTPRRTSTTMPPYFLVSTLIDQFNHYRNIDILSRIKQCDAKLKLNDICERFAFDNHTYSLIRDSYVEFQSFEHLYDALIDRIMVQKLSQHCSIDQWCLRNLTDDDIHLTMNVLRQRERSFCSLDKCQHRLSVLAHACPSIASKNISTPTLKLLPMLCALSKEPQTWNSNGCIKQIVYLIHILYAFWPQIESCHHMITTRSDSCTSECLAFDSILHKVDNQCSPNASFLSRVPALAWYRLVDLKQACRHQSIATESPFISSVKSFVSSNVLWYRLHQRPVYAALFIIVVICIVITFSLCLYVMSQNDYDSNSRRFDDDYEYTRLHDSTFELSANTEIPNTNLTSGRTVNESPFDLHANHRSSEHQRLL